MENNDFTPTGPDIGAPDQKPRARIPGFVIIVLSVAVVFLIAFMVLQLAFTVRADRIGINLIYDENNPILDTKYTRQQILDAAGIKGDFLSFTANTEAIRNQINQDYHLDCTEVVLLSSNQMRITVRQRQKRAYMDAGGVLFCIDEKGMILERGGMQRADDRLILVEGMMPTNPIVGEKLVPNKADQLAAYQEVLAQLQDLGILNLFSTLNVRDPGDLYMNSKSGYTIHLGDRTELRKKIKTVYYVLIKLDELVRTAQTQEEINKFSEGILEVLKPGKIVYSPVN